MPKHEPDQSADAVTESYGPREDEKHESEHACRDFFKSVVFGPTPRVILRKFKADADKDGYAERRTDGGMYVWVFLMLFFAGIALVTIGWAVAVALFLTSARALSSAAGAAVRAFQEVSGGYVAPASTLTLPAPNPLVYDVP